MSIDNFLKSKCIYGSGFLVPSGALYDAYIAWCQRHQETPQIASVKALTKYLKQKGYTTRRSSNIRYIEGINLSTPSTGPPSIVIVVPIPKAVPEPAASPSLKILSTEGNEETVYNKYDDYYQSTMKNLLQHYQNHMRNEPPLSSYLDHEKWRLEKEKIISHMNVLESWFVDLDEPMPQRQPEDTDETYRTDIKMWYERNIFKLKKHYTVMCPTEVIPLLEKPTTYQTKLQRYQRLAKYQEHYGHLVLCG